MSLSQLTHWKEEELLKKHDLDKILEHLCEVCSKPAIKICSTCYKTWYCSPEHEKSDRETHEINCSSPLIVETNDDIGRHYVASRDLEAGVLILEEDAAFGGPRTDKDDESSVFCLSCCILMDTDLHAQFRRCSNCRWPMCSSDCEKNPVHSKRECDFLGRYKIKFPTRFDTHNTYKGIFDLRGLFLKETGAEVWAEILKLDHVAPKLGDISLFPDLPMYKHMFGIPHEFGSTEDWNKIQGVCNINAFWSEMDSKCGNFIFVDASLFSQSCAPNASWHLRFTTPQASMQIRTTTKICQGEIIGISYNVKNPERGTYGRQNPGFICKCPRCIDPTELGTYTSAMKCQRDGCTNGLLLPVEPTDDSENSIWKCNADGCNIHMLEKKLMEIVALMNLGLKNIPLTSVENYMRKELEKVLHPNHWILLQASSRIVLENDIGYINRLTGPERDRYIWHCRRVLKVYDVIMPGLSRHRGLIMRALGPPVLRKLDEELDTSNKEETLSAALEIYEMLKEAFLCLKDSPPKTPELPDHYDIRDYSILLVMINAKEFIDALNKIVHSN